MNGSWPPLSSVPVTAAPAKARIGAVLVEFARCPEKDAHAAPGVLLLRRGVTAIAPQLAHEFDQGTLSGWMPLARASPMRCVRR